MMKRSASASVLSVGIRPRLLRLLMPLLLLLPCDVALAPPPARPVVIGTTTDYSNVLFGKLQRAANLYGTNLQQPLAIIPAGERDVLAKKLEKCLWNQFCMANVGPDGVLEEADLIQPLSAWIPQADLRDALVFFDLASPTTPEGQKEDLFSGDFFSSLPLPFLNKDNKNKDQTVEKGGRIKEEETSASKEGMSLDVLKCAVERQCAHIYVLATGDSIADCRSALEEHAPSVPSTILFLHEGVTMVPTKGWISSREQNMEGDFITSMKLRKINYDSNYDDGDSIGPGKTYPNSFSSGAETSFSAAAISSTAPGTAATATIPLEDIVEMMIQISLRTERDNVASSPRIVQLSPGDDGNDLVEKPNSDYFTMTGGKNMKQLSGTVKTVQSWEQLLSPLGGKINTDLCSRPDKPT